MDTPSFKKFMLRKIHGQNSTEYAIFEPTSGELICQSSDLAMKEISNNENKELTEYCTISNDILDFIIDNLGLVEVKGSFNNNTFTPEYIAGRIIIKWNRL